MEENTEKRKINDVYYSGAQVSMFIGDIWVDDIVSISYQATHNRTPLYGYGSQHWDLMPKGTILVTGEFSINFKEPNYLSVILARHNEFNPPIKAGDGKTDPQAAEKITKSIQENNKTFPEDPRKNLELFFSADPKEAALVKKQLTQELTSFSGKKNEVERMNHRSFNIAIGYGDLSSETIGRQIGSVQVMSKGQSINPDGRNIIETYSFIARDIS